MKKKSITFTSSNLYIIVTIIVSFFNLLAIGCLVSTIFYFDYLHTNLFMFIFYTLLSIALLALDIAVIIQYVGFKTVVMKLTEDSISYKKLFARKRNSKSFPLKKIKLVYRTYEGFFRGGTNINIVFNEYDPKSMNPRDPFIRTKFIEKKRVMKFLNSVCQFEIVERPFSHMVSPPFDEPPITKDDTLVE